MKKKYSKIVIWSRASFYKISVDMLVESNNEYAEKYKRLSISNERLTVKYYIDLINPKSKTKLDELSIRYYARRGQIE